MCAPQQYTSLSSFMGKASKYTHSLVSDCILILTGFNVALWYACISIHMYITSAHNVFRLQKTLRLKTGSGPLPVAPTTQFWSSGSRCVPVGNHNTSESLLYRICLDIYFYPKYFERY